MNLSFRCSYDDVLLFSVASGDKNPFHISYYYANDFSEGKSVCHGILLMLRSLELLRIPLTSLSIQWFTVVRCGDTIHLSMQDNVINGVSDTGQIFYRIELYEPYVKSLDAPSDNDCTAEYLPLETPHAFTFKELVSLKGKSICLRKDSGHDQQIIQLLFPFLASSSGSQILHDVAMASSVVGMVWPGLHSLFISFQLSLLTQNLAHSHEPEGSFYTLGKISNSTSMITLYGSTKRIRTKIAAFWAEHSIKSKHISHAARIITKLTDGPVPSLSGNALVIAAGGGVGAAIARLLAPYGLNLTLTYYNNRKSVQALVNEINQFFPNAECKIVRLNIEECILPSPQVHYDFVAYCASPNISATPFDQSMSQALLDRYRKCYVEGFLSLFHHAYSPDHRQVFMTPSSEYLTSPPKRYKEYVHAKSELETVASELNESLGEETMILIPRLPVMHTRQTFSGSNTRFQDPIDVLAPHVHEALSRIF